MRLLQLVLTALPLLVGSGVAFAQADTPPDQRLPAPVEVPPPPQIPHLDESLEPDVTIVPGKDGDRHEEFRIAGKLYMIKVTPKVGPPYYLIDEEGNGTFVHRDSIEGHNLVVPRWVIFRF